MHPVDLENRSQKCEHISVYSIHCKPFAVYFCDYVSYLRNSCYVCDSVNVQLMSECTVSNEVKTAVFTTPFVYASLILSSVLTS